MWHTNLPKYLSENIEMIQKRALKSIFPNKGYDDILYDLGMCTLHKDEMLFVNNILRTCKVIHTNYTICYLKRERERERENFIKINRKHDDTCTHEIYNVD